MKEGKVVVSGGFRKQRRKEVKGKGKRKRYTQLNTEFQRIAREDKKGFLNEQCKEIEENNRKGKTRDLFKKIRDTKGTFHAKMVSINDTSTFSNFVQITCTGFVSKTP